MKAILSKSKKAGKPLCGIALMSAILMLAACGEKPQPTRPPVPQTAPRATPLFQQEREALGKAKDVGQNMARSAEELKREEEKQAQ